MKREIKVLIIDDSALVRRTLSDIIDSEPGFKVIGTASDPFVAATKIAREIPDVITLDIEMPKMDGLTFLKKIMRQHPIPVIIVSTLTEKNSELGLRALELGAVEVITKPAINTKHELNEARIKILDTIRAANEVKPGRRLTMPKENIEIAPKYSADAVLRKDASITKHRLSEKTIAVGASTGGTEAIKTFLEALPLDCPGIVIVQHMPEMFTKQFANRLNSICKISVSEATNGAPVLRGHAMIAPGNKHLILKRDGTKYYVEVKDGPLVNRHRPSVDVLFRSVAQACGQNALGIIMTGMGNDGASGLKEMKEAGARTIAQDEKSCVVFGMPKEAIKIKAEEMILPLNEIAPAVIKYFELH